MLKYAGSGFNPQLLSLRGSPTPALQPRPFSCPTQASARPRERGRARSSRLGSSPIVCSSMGHRSRVR
eukprot:15475875-Alexandrium_andersonii.AAC.1